MATIKEIKEALKEKGYKTTAFVGKNKEELEEMLTTDKEVEMAEVTPVIEPIVYPKEPQLQSTAPKTEYTIVNKEGTLILKTTDKEYAETFIAGKPDNRFFK